MTSGSQQSTRLARYNRAVILDLIRRFGPQSKAELAERSGLAVSSVVNVVATLSRRGLIRAAGLGASSGGRPPALIELEPAARYAVGINIRIGLVEAVLLDLLGDIVSETALPLHGSLDVDTIAITIVEAVDQVIRLARIDAARVLGVGVGCPGPVSEGRTVVGAPALPGWSEVPLADRLERTLGVPVTLDNDANLGALAEYRHGAGSRRGVVRSLVYLYADHGIGQGIVLDAKLYRGADGLAGEIGHTIVAVDGPPCSCGGHGCLEALASVPSVVRRVLVAARLGGASELAERVSGDWDEITFPLICQAAQEGDPVARVALDEAAAYLALGATNMVRQLRPELVVLGGQLFETRQAFERFMAAVRSRPGFLSAQPTEFVPGDLGARAVPIGAATLVLESFFGVPQDLIDSERFSTSDRLAFEGAPIWPEQAEAGILLIPGDVDVRWAGNLQPTLSRVRAGEPVSVTVDVALADDAAGGVEDIKVLLHWDRVSLFGNNWPSPKNSPMHLLRADDAIATYGVTLGSLPSGKYEYAAHVLGARDLWVRADAVGDVNGRVEVLANRAAETVADDGAVTTQMEETVRQSA